jgi:hypothetical protein
MDDHIRLAERFSVGGEHVPALFLGGEAPGDSWPMAYFLLHFQAWLFSVPD